MADPNPTQELKDRLLTVLRDALEYQGVTDPVTGAEVTKAPDPRVMTVALGFLKQFVGDLPAQDAITAEAISSRLRAYVERRSN